MLRRINSQIVRTLSSQQKCRFAVEIPTVDISKHLDGKSCQSEADQILDSLNKYGVIVIRDPRVKEQYNQQFLGLMQQYFQKRQQEYDTLDGNYDKLSDCFPQNGFQVGVTPEGIEKARNHQKCINDNWMKQLPITPQDPVPNDRKWRYFWGIGDRISDDNTKFTPSNHSPSDFPEFESIMNRWGYSMLSTVESVSELCASAMNLPQNHFTDLLKQGPHLLAPTGSNLAKYSADTIFAGFHYDFNFLTIHGKSNYPGLFIWLRNGEKQSVKVEPGCLLLQAGRQFEILTGGHIMCGFHEVVYTQQAQEMYQKQGGSGWRVSSTLFSHVRNDVMLQPIQQFKTQETETKYPAISAYDLMVEELEAINLSPQQ